MGAVAGVVFAPRSKVYPEVGTSMLIYAFTAAILGGFGSLPGVIAAGLLIGVVENLVAVLFGTRLLPYIPFLVIFIVLAFRPGGLLGKEGEFGHQ